MAAQSGHREVRKTVTILRCDVTGSTALGERLDPEALRRVQTRYFEEMGDVVERHGGTVEKFIGDAVMAVFGIPQVHEDDALRGVRAAAEMRERLADLNDELERDRGVRLEVRTGVTTGEVVAGDAAAGQAFVTGDAANVAARLEQSAEPGEILVGEPTYSLVQAAVEAERAEPLSVKGKAQPLTAYRLLRVIPGAEPFIRRLETPMVGRETELGQLRDAYARATERQACELVTVLGEAGIGKSRLSEELVRALSAEARVLRGRCLSYGEGITFWPLVEVLRETDAESRAGLAALLKGEPDAELIAERVATAVGIEEGSAGTEEIFWASRKLFERLARERPLVLVLDDVQWAEPTFLDLLEHVAYLSRTAPILLLCLARSELLETRPGWPGQRLHLEPLTAGESTRLLAELVATKVLDEIGGERIAEAAHGNPLFLEHMLAMAEGNGHELALPPTIQALLASRLDRLADEERQAVECAAVAGEEFWSGAVRELSGADPGRALLELVRQDLIEPHESVFAGEDAYRFRHILVRDAAYDSIPKEARARLHEGLAHWLEQKDDEREVRHEEIVGYHLERAFRYREELGPVDEAMAALARSAAERLGRAGERALARGDISAAANLLRRAAELLPAEDPARAPFLVPLANTRRFAGDLEGARATVREAIGLAEAAGDELLGAHAAMEDALISSLLGEGPPHELRAAAEKAIDVFERLHDEAGLASAWLVMGQAHLYFQESRALRQAYTRALAHARRAGSARIETEALFWVGGDLFWDPTPVPDAIAQVESMLQEASSPHAEAHARLSLAALRALNGEIDVTRRLFAQAQERYRELGMRLDAASTVIMMGQAELIAGDPSRAETVLRRGYEELTEIGERGYASTATALLARALCLLERYDEAEQFIEISGELSDPEDAVNNVLEAAVRARIAASRGDLAEAAALAEQAVALAAKGDDIRTRGDMLMDLAWVLGLDERREEQEQAAREALRLYEQKGDRASAAKARALLEELSAEPLAERD